MTRHVVVLAGGLSHEREVSLRSGSRLHEALRGFGARRHPAGHRRRADPLAGRGQAGRRDHHPARQPRRERRDPGHSRDGRDPLRRDGRRQNCRLAYEKNIAKNLVQRAGFTTPAWMSLSHSTFRDLGAQALIGLLVGHLGLPLMVKPQHGGSALGATAGARPPRTCRPHWSTPSPTARSRWSSSSSTASRLAITVLEDEDGSQALPAVEISPDQWHLRLRVPVHRRTDHLLHPGPVDRRGRGRGRGRPGDRRAPRPRPAGRVPHRRHRHRGRRRAFPGGQCVPGPDRDLDAADGGRGGGPRPRCGVRRAWWSGRSPAAPERRVGAPCTRHREELLPPPASLAGST